jgi:hypothetical protein
VDDIERRVLAAVADLQDADTNEEQTAKASPAAPA